MNLGLGLVVALSSCWGVSGQPEYTFATKASMRITGLNYTELSMDSMKEDLATEAITDALAEIWGSHVRPWVWRVVYSPGFVVLEMNLPTADEQQNILDTIERMKENEFPMAISKYLMMEGNLTFTDDNIEVEVNKVWIQEHNGCDFSFLGFGYCAADADTEKSNRLSDSWVSGEIDAAEAACCSDEMCVGFHLDTATGTGKAASDFVLLHAVSTPDGSGGTRRMCWQKTAPEATPYEADGAMQLTAGGLALVLGLAAAY